MRRLLCVWVLWMLPMLGLAQEPHVNLKLCHVDQDEFPWFTLSGGGVTYTMLKMLEKDLGITIELLAMPWKRCLVEMQEGRVDGALPASFKTERLVFGVYPMNGDKPDPSRRLHTDGYSLYVNKDANKDSKIGWDGQQFSNVTGVIGAPTSYSIIDLLKKNNLNVDDANKSSYDILKKVQFNRLQGAAIQTLLGDFLLKTHPDFAQKIEKIEAPLEEKPYYLMLSHQIVAAQPKLARDVWAKIKLLRESPEIRQATESALQ